MTSVRPPPTPHPTQTCHEFQPCFDRSLPLPPPLPPRPPLYLLLLLLHRTDPSGARGALSHDAACFFSFLLVLKWNGELKEISSSFVGVSPEFELALYTLLFLLDKVHLDTSIRRLVAFVQYTSHERR